MHAGCIANYKVIVSVQSVECYTQPSYSSSTVNPVFYTRPSLSKLNPALPCLSSTPSFKSVTLWSSSLSLGILKHWSRFSCFHGNVLHPGRTPFSGQTIWDMCGITACGLKPSGLVVMVQLIDMYNTSSFSICDFHTKWSLEKHNSPLPLRLRIQLLSSWYQEPHTSSPILNDRVMECLS